MAKLAVASGIELTEIPTLGNLADGLQYALGRLGKTIGNRVLGRK